MFVKIAAFILLAGITCADLQAQALNTLSAQEKKEGWKLLFNGQNLNGWHRYNGKGAPSSWRIEQGVLHLDVPKTATDKPRDSGDLITDAVFSGDFEFKAEFKIEKNTNSGFFFFAQEAPQYPKIYSTAMEVQVGDDALYQKAVEHPHSSGDIFGIADVRMQEPQPLGSWNKVNVMLKKNKLTVTMNGYVVQEHDLTSADWKQRIANSKLKDTPFGKGKYSGHIGLQDWNTSVWFRNIKIRTL
ncbi:3-keto-disaccharide hydrolase [Spirosoma sp.]|uniref:3-keto-disaccharide hydrolase n=1 Tax=Spirosoma sp. TaxID=1899569 RepID=UPI003B3B9404